MQKYFINITPTTFALEVGRFLPPTFLQVQDLLYESILMCYRTMIEYMEQSYVLPSDQLICFSIDFWLIQYSPSLTLANSSSKLHLLHDD